MILYAQEQTSPEAIGLRDFEKKLPTAQVSEKITGPQGEVPIFTNQAYHIQ